METFLKKYLYFHRSDTYCIIINNDIKDIFTMKAVFIDLIFDEVFLVKGKSEILKYFFNGCPPFRVGGGRTPLILTYFNMSPLSPSMKVDFFHPMTKPLRNRCAMFNLLC